jgi:hypothetical protein
VDLLNHFVRRSYLKKLKIVGVQSRTEYRPWNVRAQRNIILRVAQARPCTPKHVQARLSTPKHAQTHPGQFKDAKRQPKDAKRQPKDAKR